MRSIRFLAIFIALIAPLVSADAAAAGELGLGQASDTVLEAAQSVAPSPANDVVRTTSDTTSGQISEPKRSPETPKTAEPPEQAKPPAATEAPEAPKEAEPAPTRAATKTQTAAATTDPQPQTPPRPAAPQATPAPKIAEAPAGTIPETKPAETIAPAETQPLATAPKLVERVEQTAAVPQVEQTTAVPQIEQATAAAIDAVAEPASQTAEPPQPAPTPESKAIEPATRKTEQISPVAWPDTAESYRLVGPAMPLLSGGSTSSPTAQAVEVEPSPVQAVVQTVVSDSPSVSQHLAPTLAQAESTAKQAIEPVVADAAPTMGSVLDAAEPVAEATQPIQPVIEPVLVATEPVVEEVQLQLESVESSKSIVEPVLAVADPVQPLVEPVLAPVSNVLTQAPATDALADTDGPAPLPTELTWDAPGQGMLASEPTRDEVLAPAPEAVDETLSDSSAAALTRPEPAPSLRGHETYVDPVPAHSAQVAAVQPGAPELPTDIVSPTSDALVSPASQRQERREASARTAALAWGEHSPESPAMDPMLAPHGGAVQFTSPAVASFVPWSPEGLASAIPSPSTSAPVSSGGSPANSVNGSAGNALMHALTALLLLAAWRTLQRQSLMLPVGLARAPLTPPG